MKPRTEQIAINDPNRAQKLKERHELKIYTNETR
jgi:hypothetical protein